ncbi:hypothetical protein Save01_09143 [Streptomyces avermitilis]
MDNYNFGWVTSHKYNNSANASIWMAGMMLDPSKPALCP